MVRDKAVESLCKVGEKLPDASINEHYVPLIKVRSLLQRSMRRPMRHSWIGSMRLAMLCNPGCDTVHCVVTEVWVHSASTVACRQTQEVPSAPAMSHCCMLNRFKSDPADCLCMHLHMVYLQRLASGDWFTARVSACGLFAVAYPRASPGVRVELRQLYSQLCRDETPMVRRAAAQKLGGYVATVEKDIVGRDLLPMFTDLSSDGKRVKEAGSMAHCSAAFRVSRAAVLCSMLAAKLLKADRRVCRCGREYSYIGSPLGTIVVLCRRVALG